MLRFTFMIMLLATCLETFAQAYIPSKLIDGGDAFVRRINPPEEPPQETVIVFVTGEVKTSGRFTGRTTWSNGTSERASFERAVRSALRAIRLSPAIVDSKKRPVWVTFSVVFENVNGIVEVSVHPYLHSAESGVEPSFSAPQRVVGLGYPNRCNTHPGVIWTSVQVSAAGTPSKPEVIGTEGLCQNSLIKILLNSTYIPAFLNGSAIDSSYFEPWFLY